MYPRTVAIFNERKAKRQRQRDISLDRPTEPTPRDRTTNNRNCTAAEIFFCCSHNFLFCTVKSNSKQQTNKPKPKTMKTVIFASLVASAAAFAPSASQQKAASTTSLAAYEDALGSQPPLGFFDPLGMLNNASEERFERLRYTELK